MPMKMSPPGGGGELLHPHQAVSDPFVITDYLFAI